MGIGKGTGSSAQAFSGSNGANTSTDSIDPNIAVDTADWQCSFVPDGCGSCWANGAANDGTAVGGNGAGGSAAGDWVGAAAPAEGCMLVHSHMFQMLTVELQVRTFDDTIGVHCS
jgi:hypothetical protein